MQSLDALLIEKREATRSIVKRHGMSRVLVFGSMARDDARFDSDVDFLVEVNGPTSPWFPGDVVADVEKLLGKPVDIVEIDAVNSMVRNSILKDAVSLWMPCHYESGSSLFAA